MKKLVSLIVLCSFILFGCAGTEKYALYIEGIKAQAAASKTNVDSVAFDLDDTGRMKSFRITQATPLPAVQLPPETGMYKIVRAVAIAGFSFLGAKEMFGAFESLGTGGNVTNTDSYNTTDNSSVPVVTP